MNATSAATARAAELLRECAAELKMSHTIGGSDVWTGEDEAKAAHDEYLAVAAALDARALTSAPAATPPAAERTAPMCRDCADFGPICPNTGKPCAPPAAGAIDARGHVTFEAVLPRLQERLQDHTCERVEHVSGAPELTLYITKAGAHPEYQLFVTEACALWFNLGKALAPILKSRQEAPAAAGAAQAVAEAAQRLMSTGCAAGVAETKQGGDWLLAVEAMRAALAATPAPERKEAPYKSCRMDDGRCGICGGDWSVCGCEGMLRRTSTPEPDDSPLETGDEDAR